MSLKIKTAARLKVLFPGVALSKKTIELIGDQMSKAGLTDESTDEEVDGKLNDRNAIYPFEDQKKFDDYQAGKAAKEASDKEALRLKAIEDGKTPPIADDPNETPTEKLLKQALAGIQTLTQEVASIKGEKVATTRKQTAAEKLKDAPEAFRNGVLADMDDITFRDDDHLNSFLERKIGEAALVIQDKANSGLGGDAPSRGIATGGKTAEKEVSAEMKQYLADRAAEKPKTTA